MNAPTPILTPDSIETPSTTPFTAFDGQLAYLPLDWIAVQPHFNPRTFFEDSEFAALVESVRAQGVLQAVWVRPVTDYDPAAPRFWLIAGERRWRAAHAAGVPSIPATIRFADAQHALVLADLENNAALRINLSVAEEAHFAQRFVGECAGERAEAARLLGWSRAKLDARLLLLHAAPAVLDALTQRKIQVGHAELLAGLPEATQNGTLAKILSDKISVADLKARIKGFALDLSVAIFDKSACVTCRHHSALQASLFAEAVEGGRCQDRACHHQKTWAALAARKAELESTYPAVFLDTERSADQFVVLSETGLQGVGKAQFSACQGCRSFGAQLSTQPGREGTVQAPLCVHPSCHAQKVAAAHPAPPPTAPTVSTASTLDGDSVSTPATAPALPPSDVDADDTDDTDDCMGTGEAEGYPRKVEAWVDTWLRQQAAQITATQPNLLRAWLLLALFREAGEPRAILAEVGITVDGRTTRTVLLPQLYALSTEGKQHLLTALARHLIEQKPAIEVEIPGHSEPAQAAVASLQAVAADMTAAFVPDESFWQAHTKAGIASLLATAKSPAGEFFATWYAREHRESDTDTQAFQRLLKGSRSALIAALTQTRFDFSAWLPSAIARRFQN